MKRILGVSLASAALLFAGAAPAFAHGQEAQEAWLRMNSIAWLNVQVNGQEPGGETGPDVVLKQGDTLKLTGSAKVLETWPKTLNDGNPQTGYINVVTPGPVMLVKDRVINGIQAPDSIYIEKGGIYDFEITLQARIPGRYHVHPTFAVQGAGTLIGPGQWVKVEKAAGGFKNEVKLYNGKTINLENYKVWWVFGWTFAGFIIGMVWLLWWIWPKPTVSRLAVTSQLSVNDDGGPAVGLVTKRDLRAMDIIALVTVIFVGIGLLWQANSFPTKLPIQVQRFRIPPVAQPAVPFATATATDVVLDNKTNSYSMKVTVNNTGTGDATIKALHIANVKLVPAENTAVSDTADVPADTVAVSPSTTVTAGSSADLVLRMPRAQLESLKLVPSQNANSSVAGVLEVSSAAGETEYLTVNATMNYIFASGK